MLTLSGEEILVQLGIEPGSLSSMRSHWKRASYRAVINWLTKQYAPPPTASNIERVKGVLQAFDHLCEPEVEDWKAASRILAIRLHTATNDFLPDQLRTWGYYQKLIALYEKLLDKLEPGGEFVCLKGLCDAHLSQGEYRQALERYEQALPLIRAIGDRQAEGAIL